MNFKNLLIALIAILPLILFALVLFPKPDFYSFGGTDSYLYIYGMRPTIANQMFCGLENVHETPDLWDFYPPAFLSFSFLKSNYAYYYFFLLTLAMGAAAFYAYLSRHIVEDWIKGIGTAFYLTSAGAINIIVWGSSGFLSAFAFTPLLLYLIEDLIKKRSLASALLYGGGMGLFMLAGGVMFLPFFAAILLIYAAYEKNKKEYIKLILFSIVGFQAVSLAKTYLFFSSIHEIIDDHAWMYPTGLDRFLGTIYTLFWPSGWFSPIFSTIFLILITPAFYLFWLGFKNSDKLYKVVFLFALWEAYSPLPILGMLTQHNNTRYAVCLSFFITVFIVKGIKELWKKNQYRVYQIVPSLTLVFLVFFAIHLVNFRSFYETPMHTQETNEIAKTLNGSWLITSDEFIVKSFVYQQLLDSNVKVVNPLFSITYFRNYTCGEYYLSESKNLTEGGFRFNNDWVNRSRFKLLNPRVFGNYTLYRIGGAIS